jgi:hypothetical protein
MKCEDQENRIEHVLSRNGRKRWIFVRVMMTVLSRGIASKVNVVVDRLRKDV